MKKRWQRVLALLATTLVALEAASWLSLRSLEKTSEAESGKPAAWLDDSQREAIARFIRVHEVSYQRLDPDLGWINAAPYRHRESNGVESARGGVLHYTQNSQGVRATREYAVRPARDVLRVAAFGDSFVHGDEVDDDDVWSAKLEDLEPSIEVLNFGVSGYGIDQAYLRYLRDGPGLSPAVVILGIIVDDVWRNLNIFRPFLAPGTGHQMTKPRFLLEYGDLRLLPNPLDTISDYQRLLENPEATLGAHGRHDAYSPQSYRSTRPSPLSSLQLAGVFVEAWTRPERPDPSGREVLDSSSEAYQLTLALIEAFAAAARESGTIPLIAFLPEAQDVRRRQAGQSARYGPLLEALDDRVWWIDVDRNFAEWAPDASVSELFLKFHYSPRGNELVARSISDALRSRGLIPE